jgi:hypothetical protein
LPVERSWTHTGRKLDAVTPWTIDWFWNNIKGGLALRRSIEREASY